MADQLKALLPCPFCNWPGKSGDGFLPLESIVFAWCSNPQCELHDIEMAGFTLDSWNNRSEPVGVPTVQAGDAFPASQEPKYGIREGRLFNRASGEFIPDDEPVFIFRARDKKGKKHIAAYANDCQTVDAEHYRAVAQRVADFSLFELRHPDRMKWPDTTAPSQPVAGKPSDEQIDFNVQSADFAGLKTAIKIIKSIDDGESPEYMACIEAIQSQITTANAGKDAK